MRKEMMLVLAAAVLAGCANERQADPGVKVSERFGYDAKDATRFLQAALDSGLPKIVIDRQAGPWYALPLKGRSNQEIVIEEGAELKALRGAYQDAGACLLTFACQSNIVLRGKGTISMWRADYDTKRGVKSAAGYDWSEWRHAVSVRSCQNVLVEDLTIGWCGGDCLYLGVAGDTSKYVAGRREFANNRDITLRRCRFVAGYRQGLSVISAANLLVEDCLFQDTKGTPPEDGIDFEPNHPSQLLENILVRNCRFVNNAGRAFETVIYQYDHTAKPVSIRVENCTSERDFAGVRFYGSLKDALIPSDDGLMEVVNCTFKDVRTEAIEVVRKPFNCGVLAFKDCLFDGVQTEKPNRPDVLIQVSGHETFPTDTISFENVTFRQTAARDWLSAPLQKVYRGAPTKIAGEVKTVDPSGRTTVHTLDDAWRAKRYPSVPGTPVVSLEPAGLDARAAVTDLAPGTSVALSPIANRGGAVYAFYAAKPGTVHFAGRQSKVGTRAPQTGVMTVTRYGEKTTPLAKVPLPQAYADVPFAVDVPAKGYYRLAVGGTGGNGFILSASDVPVAFDVTAKPVDLIYPEGDFFISDSMARQFGIMGMGTGVENFSGKVYDPSGALVYEQKNSIDTFHFATEKQPMSGMWKFTIGKPDTGALEDCRVQVTGLPGFLFLTDKKYWE